ncbi:HAD family hydrolase [Pokkaliibacter sp. MBI-7]|uniref:HAD family hydrolase n=1 Tax=Pokkaliibacter sp. MBI-7 TaxID=3040600 RepID=UPI0024482F96|nr:HAD family hydrolase [Pokkaliibacter sp. MBI-7]MDH2432637.1 HAD family hydrolase [Pokkaliibacter sp. MBI-7]
MKIQAVLFDCDGVLVDSEPLSKGLLLTMITELGIEHDLGQRLISVSGQRMSECLDNVAEWLQRPLPGDFLEQFRQREYVLLRQQLQPIPGIHSALERLTLPRAVASNGPMEKILINLDSTGLRHHFGEHLYSAYDLDRHKPDPALYLHAAAQLGIEPAACLVVEDSPFGAEAGLRAGMTVVGYGEQRVSLQQMGTLPLADMAQLPDLISALTTDQQ